MTDATLQSALTSTTQTATTQPSTTQPLTTQVSQLLHTSLSGSASVGLDLSSSELPQGDVEHVNIAWQAPFDPSTATVTHQFVSGQAQQALSPPSEQSPTASPLLGEVNTAVGDFKSLLTDVQSVLNTATVLAQDLPFVGKNLGTENMLAPVISDLSALQSKLNSDLQNNSTVLSTIQSDIASIFTAAGLLPDGTSDVQLYYQTTQDGSTHKFAGETTDLTKITALEFDLVLGQTWHSSSPIGFDFGFPGLGLTVNNSTINGTIGWTFDFGFGFNSSNAYTVVSPGNGGSTLALNLSYTLGPTFTALGTMGFLEALITEHPLDAQHTADTGLSGSIGIALGSSGNEGAALNGGTKLALGDIGSITASPTFSLAAHSDLALAFGGDFQKDQSGNYTDASKFPSIDADLKLDWAIGGSSPSSGAAPAVGLSNLQLDIGQAITDFILPVIKPFYDETHGLEPIIDFLTSQVPVVGDTIKWAHDNLGDAADLAIEQVLKTYDPSQPYDWLHFGVDLLIADGTIDEATGKDFVKASEAVFQIIHELDTVYGDAQTAAQTNPSLKINLGDFDFGGKDLRLAAFKPTSASDLSNYTGNAIVDFSGLNQNDPQVQAAISSYMGAITNLLPGGVRNALNGVVSTISDVYNTLFAAGDLASELPGLGGIGGPEQTLTKVTTPFFDDPASIIGILFGQNIDFIDVQLGYSYHYHKVQEFPVLSLFKIVDINLIFDTTMNFDVGLSFGYDTKGLVELLGHQANASLLDGIFIGGDPLLPGSNDVFKLNANIFVGAGADVLAGLAGAGIEGGLGLDVTAALLTGPNETELHYDEFSSDTDFNLADGLMGPIKLKADGWAQLRLMTEEFWGVARQYHDLTPKEIIFNYPSNSEDLGDIYPLAFYHASTGELDLYVGPTADQRFVDADGVYHGPPIDNNPQSADDELALLSDVYDITIDAGDKVTLSAYGATQTFSGPVKTIVATTGSGDDIIHVHNNAPNDVQVKITGSGSAATLYNTGNGDQSGRIGGNDVFDAAGGNATLVGGDGNDLLTGGTGNDVIQGNDGNDTVVASGGQDSIDGGAGTNLLDFSNWGSSVTANLAAGTATGGTLNDQIANFTVVKGTKHNDSITGDNQGDLIFLGDGNNSVYGGTGNDSVDGGGGNNFINAGDGNNVISVGDGNNTLLAGSGDDSITAGNGANSISAGDGNNTIGAGGGRDTIIAGVGADSITAGDGNDSIDAGDGNDTIFAGNGNDTVYGRGGDDFISLGFGADYVDAGDGNDSVTTGNGNDTIYGGTGDDSITTGNGANIVDGGGGNDYIATGSGNDHITGDDGNDTILAGDGKNYVDGGTGDDSIVSGIGISIIIGGDGNDSIFASSGADSIDGGIGNDYIVAGTGTGNSITGGDGNDTIYGGNGNDTIYGGNGHDTIDAGTGDDIVYDGQGGSLIFAGTGNNTVYGGAGNDTITAADGNNTIYGGGGNDSITVGQGANYLSGDAGNDTIATGNGNNTILGGTGDDSITAGLAGAGANSIDGGDGNDTIAAGNGNNTILGGTGADSITAGPAGFGKNSIDGGDGNDTIVTGSGSDTVFGGIGNDSITAGDGIDSIYGGDGNDIIVAGNGNDWIEGNAGSDSITAGDGNSHIFGDDSVASAGNGDDTIKAGNGQNTIDGGAGNDLITAGNGANYITGDDGNDSIYAGNGGNTVYGGTGADSIVTGSGADFICGGDGNDSIYAGDGNNVVYGNADSDLIVAGNGNNLIFGDDSLPAGTDGNDSISAGTGNNTIYGGAGDDSISVAGGNNLIDGGDGNDSIVGGTGQNSIYGGTGNDSITGGAGANIIYGEAGNDTIVGGAGSNLIYGGDGSDSVVGGAGINSIYGGAGADFIQGGTGSNVLVAGDSGHSTIKAGAGTDTMIASGGVGNFFYGNGTDVIYGSPDAGTGPVDYFNGTPQGDVIWAGDGNVAIFGGAGASIIITGTGNDSIVAGSGGNFIWGGGGNDTIIGGAGVDLIFGGSGVDSIVSGGGDDVIHARNGGMSVALSPTGQVVLTAGAPIAASTLGTDSIMGGSGNSQIFGDAGSNLINGGSGVASITGGTGQDIIYGGSGTGVYIKGGSGGEVIIGSDGGHDVINGGSGGDRIEVRGGNNVVNGGPGDDVIVGGTGNDSISGGGGSNVLVGGDASDVLNGTSLDQLFPASGITGDSLSSPTPAATVPSIALPSDAAAQGWWSQIAGPAGIALGLGQNTGVPAITADATGPYVAWTQTVDGTSGLYVAHYVNGTWTDLAGSTVGTGLQGATGSAANPSIAMVGGKPVAAWTSIGAGGASIRVAEFDATANGGQGAWVALGNSLSAGGISGIGNVDDAKVVATAAGPVVFWRDLSSATPHLFAEQFDGTNWVTVGTGSASGQGISGTTPVAANYAIASDGTKLAAAFVRPSASGDTIEVVEYSAGTWQTLADPISSPLQSGFSEAPSLAYAGGSLFLAWVQRDPTTGYDPHIFVASEQGGVWTPAGNGAASGLGVSTGDIVSGTPELAASGSTVRLVWTATIRTATGLDDVLRTLSWNGTAFVADRPTDITGTGIGDLHGAPESLALTLDPSGRAWLASETPGGTGFSVRAGTTSAAHVFVADATHSIQSILSGGAIATGDHILVTATTTTDTDITLGASASGIAIVGLDGVSFAHGIAINGANGVTIRNLDIAGAVSVTNASGISLAENTFRSHVTISNASGFFARDNRFLGTDQGLVIATASNGKIVSNAFVGSTQDLVINATFTGSITGNDISGGGTGVVYGAYAPLSGNRIHNNQTGIVTPISAQAAALGFAAGTGSNDIFQNVLGVQMQNAALSGQHIFNNTTGVSGSGVLGGNDMSGANLIAGNQTGVASFNGTIHFNRIEANGVGIAATSAQVIFDNQIVSNTTAGILASGVTKVEIAGNTIRAFVGDGVRIVNQSTNIELTSNIFWTANGYDIYVANDSQAGFWSDYNTLFADGTGKIVYWTKDFIDILDWQDDVGRFDLHSDGVTVVNPRWAQPHFSMGLDGVLTTRPVVAGQRLTDPTTSGGDPAGSFIGYRGVPNLLANGSFESGLTGWTVTTGGAATTGGPSAWDGSSVFVSGPAGSAVAQQSLDLVAAGFSASAIDSGSLQVAFGGRVELTNGSQQAQISLVFRDKDGNAIGSPVVVAAGTDVSRWQRVFDTVYIPTGARTAQYLFGVTNANSSTGAALDAAFLGVIPRGTSVSQGDVPPGTTVPLDATDGRLALRSPDLYVDWQLNTPMFITWDSFGAAAGAAVRIELWQDSPSGPVLRSLITASTPDTGRYAWTPSSSGLDYGTYGLHIRIVSVADPSVYDMSTEPFTVPENGNTYYVNDGSKTGDQYTTAVGSNRNDGKLPSAPKPNPVNLFREYDITAGATVYVDTGNYPLIYTLQLSGSVDRGLGLDTAFTIDGPTNAGATATFFTAIPGARPGALIDLLDADFVTLNNLSLQGGTTAVYVHGGSDTFAASYLSASGQSGNAFDITTNSPNGALDHLTATNAGGEGLQFNGTIKKISHFTAVSNKDGAVISGTIGSIVDSTFSNNLSYGLNLQISSGTTTLQSDTFSGNSTGAYLQTSGSGSIVFGNANLGLALGNNVFGNTSLGVRAEGATQVVGDAIYGNVGALGLWVRNGASAADDLVYGNATGIEMDSGTTLQGNRVYANTNWGISATNGSSIIDNVIYSNGVGLYVSGTGMTVHNNLIYADTYAGLRFTNGGGVVANNTFYEPTAGTQTDGTSYGEAAVDIENGATSVTLTDNIIVALAGIGVRVADAAEAGFVSDYNLFNTGTGGRVGNWIGLDRTSLAQWRSATQRDANSRFGDPSFVNPTGADGVLGYSSPSADGGDDDFHVKSLNGSFHGGSLAVVRNTTTGLPVFPAATLTNDTVNSIAIDRGDPSVPVAAEPAPNGNIIEIGAYGGTAQASLSPAAFLDVVSPDGGETLFQGTTATIKWNTFNVSGTVDLAATTDGVHFTTIATGVANTGQYSWAIDGGVFAAGATYQVRVSSTSTPTIFGLSDQPFTISAPVHAYYINDNSTVGDQYTTAVGNDANSGLTPDAPMATFQALLAKYGLHGGDTVYVDTGNYALTTNIIFTSSDSGTSDTQRVVVQGPTNAGDTATINRSSRSSGFYAFEFKGAQFVSLQNLHITGGNYGVVIDDNVNSVNITLANDTIDGNNNGVYVGVGDNNFLMSSSTVAAQSSGSGSGVYLVQTTGATVTGSTFTNFQWGANLNSTTNSLLRSDNFVNDTGATTTSFDNNILFDQLTVNGGYYGIDTYRTNGVIQNNVVQNTQAVGLEADGYSSSGTQTLLTTGNTIYNIGGSNSGAAALTVSGSISTATNNVIYSSAEGISVSGGYATGNRVFNISDFGIEVGFNSYAIGNKVYDNGIGILAVGSNATLTNNTIYDNAIGIQVNRNNNGPNGFNISNNTIVQPTGTAIKLVGNPYNYTVRDNIISLGASALGLDAPATAQIGYTSDYNLWDLTPGAKVVSWAGQVLTLDQVKTQLGLDTNSFAANPLFNNPAGPDGIRGFVSGVDHGADDDFSLQAGSPAIDRGDPTAAFYNEPVGANFGDGARIDIGAGGNSANAAQSPSQLVQLLGQTGGQRYQVGQTANITFRSDGLVGQDPVLFLNVGGGQVVGSQPWNVFQADQFRLAGNSYNRTNSKAVDTSNVDAPAAVFQTLADLNYNSPSIAYGIPLADGNYQVKLLFDDPDSTAVGQRKFDIVANGTTVQSNYDIFAAAGGANKAVAYTLDTSATGGKGLRIDLMLKTGDVILSGIEITRILPPQPTWTASIDVSLDNGATWANIASGLALDRLGDGSFSWTPTAATAGTQGLLRITATDGVHTLTDQSIAPFMVAPAGHSYYVNDGSTAGDVFTTAVGNDANSGKTPDAPMANLASLLSLYKLQPGDTVYIDSGTYNLSSNLVLGAGVSGTPANPINFVGAGNSTILARAGTAVSTDVIDVNGAHDLSFSNLALTGGLDGFDINDFSNSANISLSGLDVSKFGGVNFNNGIFVGVGSTGFSLTNSFIHDPVGGSNQIGLKLSDPTNYQTLNATVTGNTFKNLGYGVEGGYNNNVTISNNTFLNNSVAGISVAQSIVNGAILNVTNNVVTGGGGVGIYVGASYSGSVVASGNKVSGIANGTGIQVQGGVLAQNNETFGNKTGFQAGNGLDRQRKPYPRQHRYRRPRRAAIAAPQTSSATRSTTTRSVWTPTSPASSCATTCSMAACRLPFTASSPTCSTSRATRSTSPAARQSSSRPAAPT